MVVFTGAKKEDWGQGSSLERNALCGAGRVEEIIALRTSTNAIEFSGLFSHTKQKAAGHGKDNKEACG